MTCSPSLLFRFPLYNKGKEKIQFYYGTFLLNKNIAQVKFLSNSHSLQRFSVECGKKAIWDIIDFLLERSVIGPENLKRHS